MNKASVTPMRKTGNKRWFIAVLLLVGGLINYLDRASLSIAAPAMMDDLKLTNTDIGLMGSVFSLVYAFTQLPAGWLADKFGSKKIYSLSVGTWSIATMLTGLCSSVTSLLVARGLLGLTEAPGWPTSAKITAAWFPKKERALATAVWDSSSRWGLAFAPPILVLLLVSFGWRELFFIVGGIGLVFVAFFLVIYKQPEQDRKLSESELRLITAENEADISTKETRVSWGGLFKYKTMWGMVFGWFCYIWLFNIFLNFLPLYLMKTQHITLASLGIYSGIPWIGGIVGAYVGGYVSKKMSDRPGELASLNAKRIVIVISAVITGCATVAIPFAGSLMSTLWVTTVAMFALSSLSANCWAVPGDVSPPGMVGSVGSIQNFGGFFAGALSPLVTGYIADITGSYNLAFISGGIIAACTGVCYWLLVRKPISALNSSSSISLSTPNHQQAK